ncbi:MAG: hypothetical protein ACYS74_04815, partial [Planctomycetota bacterium]
TVELPASLMGRYVTHLAHATQVVNPQEFKLRKKTVKKCHRIVERITTSKAVQDILAADSLDH